MGNQSDFTRLPPVGIAGTPVDPVSAGGSLIDLATEVAGILSLGDVSGTLAQLNATITDADVDAIGTPRPPTDYRYPIEYSTTAGVPVAGTRYLDRSAAPSSSIGTVLWAASTLIGIAISADAINGDARAYDVEILTDPAGVATVIATLAMPNGAAFAKRRDLAVAIPVDTKIGARIVRSAGGGPSDWTFAIVELELGVAA